MYFSDFKVGINAGHIKQSALNAKSLATLRSEQPEALREAYVASGVLPKTASVDAALEYKKMLIQKELAVKKTGKRNLVYNPIYDKADLQNFCKGKSPEELMEALGIKTHGAVVDGKKFLESYGWAPPAFSFEIAGVNEELLLKDVVGISGTCNLRGSSLKNLGEVESVGILSIPQFTKLQDLSGLKNVHCFDLKHCTSRDEAVKFLKNLKVLPEVIEKAIISISKAI